MINKKLFIIAVLLINVLFSSTVAANLKQQDI